MLLANGHPQARRYTIATIWYEAQLVTERVNSLISTETILMQAAMAMTLNAKAGGKHFKKLLKRLSDGN